MQINGLSDVNANWDAEQQRPRTPVVVSNGKKPIINDTTATAIYAAPNEIIFMM